MILLFSRFLNWLSIEESC